MARRLVPPNHKVRRRKSGKEDRAYIDTSILAAAEIQEEFVHVSSPDRKAKLVEKLLASRQIAGLGRVGAMCIEMASRQPHLAAEWLERADSTLKGAVFSLRASGLLQSVEMVKAQRLLDSLPHYYNVFVNGQLPNSEWNRRMFGNLLATAVQTTELHTHANRLRATKPRMRKIISEFAGEIAEQTVQLIGLRAAAEIGPQSWSPIPSLYSEHYRAQGCNSYLLRSWDLTIQTDCGDGETGIGDTHLVQVTSSDGAIDSSRYTDDIVVLAVRPDLMIDGESALYCGDIVGEFVRAAAGDELADSNLSARQELFLDKIS